MSTENNVSDFMQIVRTVYGSALQTALLRGLTYTIPEHSTLNEKFGVESGTQPKTTPVLRYYAIGSGGHRTQAGADGIPYTAPIRHRASDAACYNHEPFVLRQEGNELSADELSKYALRVRETYGTKNYVGVYLKRMTEDETSKKIVMEHTTVVAGVPNTVPFIPTSDNLKPVAPATSSRESTTTNGDFLSVSNDCGIEFTEQDVTEYINVARIKYDNPLRAIISELALCTGTDQASSGQGSATSANLNYNEAVGVQVATHVTVYHAVGYTNKGFSIRVDLGATEPMMGEGALDVTTKVTATTDNVRE